MKPTHAITLLVTVALTTLTAGCGDDTAPAVVDASTPPVVDSGTTTEPTPGTTAPTATAPPPSDPGDDTVDEYRPTTSLVTIAGDRTAPILDDVDDGIYFAADYSAAGGGVVFTLSQYFMCDSGTNVPEHPTVVCASGFGTLDDPTIDVELAADATVTITTGDLDSPSFAQVSANEFARLVDGESPSPGAPTGFVFTSRPMFVEVSGGIVVDASQFYMS